jgi:hypothetical protein
MPSNARSRSRPGLARSGWHWWNRQIPSGTICPASGISRKHFDLRQELPKVILYLTRLSSRAKRGTLVFAGSGRRRSCRREPRSLASLGMAIGRMSPYETNAPSAPFLSGNRSLTDSFNPCLFNARTRGALRAIDIA